MTARYLTTRELAELLRIKERKVYDLVANGKVPYSKTTGKLLFPRAAIEQWLEESSVGVADYVQVARPSVFLGSHDPLLDWAIRESRCGLATIFDSSLDGLARYRNREGVATGLHVLNPARDLWNVALVEDQSDLKDAVLLHWAKRNRGLVLNEQLAGKIRNIRDVRGLRFAARQPSAGASGLFQTLLERNDMTIDDVQSEAPGRSESDVALGVVENKADFAFGLESIAAQYRLPFVPLVEEQFDLLVDRRSYFEPGIQTLFSFSTTDAFRERAREMAGYDISNCGEVRLNT